MVHGCVVVAGRLQRRPALNLSPIRVPASWWRPRRRMSKLPAGSVDLVFADPHKSAAQGRPRCPDESHVDAVNNDWDKFSSFAAYDDFTRAWPLACRRVMKAVGDGWGDRLLSQHFSRRRDHRIWASGFSTTLSGARQIRCRIWAAAASPTPTNHDLGRARRNAKGYTFNYEALKAANEDVQARSDWLIRSAPARRLKALMAEGPHPERRSVGSRAAVIQTRRSRDRSVQRYRHHRCRRQAFRPPHRVRRDKPMRGGSPSPPSNRCRKPHSRHS